MDVDVCVVVEGVRTEGVPGVAVFDEAWVGEVGCYHGAGEMVSTWSGARYNGSNTHSRIASVLVLLRRSRSDSARPASMLLCVMTWLYVLWDVCVDQIVRSQGRIHEQD